MKPKPVVLSDRASVEVAQIVRHYSSNASADIARSFAGAVQDAVQHLSLFPATGSTRWDLRLDWPELRSWPVGGFPYLLLYVEGDDTIDIYRVLHTARDIPESLREVTED